MTQDKQIKIYMLVTALFVTLAIILIFVPDKHVVKQNAPPDVIKDYNQGNAFYTTDQVAKLIMESNPVLQLVDVRSKKGFQKFSLENAINIPIQNLFDKTKKGKYKWQDYLLPDHKITVFYSNGDIKSTEAWALSNRLDFKNVYIMEGGLNKWVETILRPKPINYSTATFKEIEIYNFRKAASSYFGGGSANIANDSEAKPKNKKTVVKKKKETAEEEGC